MGFDQEYSSKEFLHYKILCKSKIDNYQRDVLIHLKIENAWLGSKEATEEAKDEQIDDETLKENIIENSNEEQIKEINVSDLISFYNYEEK